MSSVYPSATYTVWLCDPLGHRLELVEDWTEFSYARAHGAVGRAVIQRPFRTVDRKLLERDYVWEVWRALPGIPKRLVYAGMARRFRFREEERRDIVEVGLEDGMGLIYSRNVAYASGTSQAQKSDQVDDLMKAIVRENLGSTATDTDRDLSAYNFTVAADVGLGPSTNLAFSRQKVGEVLDKLFWDSAAQSNPVFYDVEPFLTGTGLGWNFFTVTGQLGSDRTYGSGMPAIFSREFGNLENPDLSYDYEDEVTVAYVGGQGEGAGRMVESVMANGRRYASPWNRRETFFNGSNLTTVTQLQKKAAQIRREGRPKTRFTATLKDTAQTRYGLHWFYGDKVAVRAYGVEFDAWINAIGFRVDSNRRETLDCRVEVLL